MFPQMIWSLIKKSAKKRKNWRQLLFHWCLVKRVVLMLLFATKTVRCKICLFYITDRVCNDKKIRIRNGVVGKTKNNNVGFGLGFTPSHSHLLLFGIMVEFIIGICPWKSCSLGGKRDFFPRFPLPVVRILLVKHWPRIRYCQQYG